MISRKCPFTYGLFSNSINIGRNKLECQLPHHLKARSFATLGQLSRLEWLLSKNSFIPIFKKVFVPMRAFVPLLILEGSRNLDIPGLHLPPLVL